MKFCTDVLGVQRQTTNVGVLLELGRIPLESGRIPLELGMIPLELGMIPLELGRIPLCVYAKKNCIKNWDRIAVQEKSNKISKTSYDWVTKNNVKCI